MTDSDSEIRYYMACRRCKDLANELIRRKGKWPEVVGLLKDSRFKLGTELTIEELLSDWLHKHLGHGIHLEVVLPSDCDRIPDMDAVFVQANRKFMVRSTKPGYTQTPWKDFDENLLAQRVRDEIREWQDSGDPKELLDIINTAAFLYHKQVIQK